MGSHDRTQGARDRSPFSPRRGSPDDTVVHAPPTIHSGPIAPLPGGRALAAVLLLALGACDEIAPAPAPAPTVGSAPLSEPVEAESVQAGSVQAGSVEGRPIAGDLRGAAGSARADAERTGGLGPGRASLDLGRFVPNHATGYVEFESMEALEELVLRFRSEGGLEGLVEWQPSDLLAPFQGAGLDVRNMRHDAPFALALAPLPGSGETTTVLVLPALDQAPLVRSIAAMSAAQRTATRVQGDYVVIQHEDLPATADARGAAPVTEALPPGVVRGRMTPDDLTASLAPLLAEAVDALNERYRVARPHVPRGDLEQLDHRDLLAPLQAAEEVAFGLELDLDRVEVHARLMGSAVARGRAAAPAVHGRVLEALGRHLDPADAFGRLLVFDPEDALEDLLSAWRALSTHRVLIGDAPAGIPAGTPGLEITAAARGQMQAALLEMLETFEGAAALSLGLEPGEAHAALHLVSNDPARTREAISLLLAKCDLDGWGFEMALPVRGLVEETVVEDYCVRFDTRRVDFDERAALRESFKRYLGDSKLHLKVATAEDHVLLLLGGDTPAAARRIRAFGDAGARDGRIAAATERVGDLTDVEVHHSDLIRLIADAACLRSACQGEAPPATTRELRRRVEDDPAHLTTWSAVEGDDEVLGAAFELGGLRSALVAFERSGL